MHKNQKYDLGTFRHHHEQPPLVKRCKVQEWKHGANAVNYGETTGEKTEEQKPLN